MAYVILMRVWNTALQIALCAVMAYVLVQRLTQLVFKIAPFLLLFLLNASSQSHNLMCKLVFQSATIQLDSLLQISFSGNFLALTILLMDIISLLDQRKQHLFSNSHIVQELFFTLCRMHIVEISIKFHIRYNSNIYKKYYL